MKVSLFVLFLLAALSVPALHAQQLPCPISADTTFIPTDTLRGSFTLIDPLLGGLPSLDGKTAGGEGGSLLGGSTKPPRTGQVTWEIFVFSVQGGGAPVISISPGSILFSGDVTLLSSLSMADLFQKIAEESIRRAVAAGSIPCTPSCGGNFIRVSQPACVRPIGLGNLGNLISLAACQPITCCVKTYSVCCPNGSSSPQVQLVASDCPGCSGAECVSTTK